MITVVIPSLNEETYIGALLESVCMQDLEEPLEVVIADAGSTDGTLAVIESFKSRCSSLQVVPGGLPAVARNNGARASHGDLIFFLDADTTLLQKDFLRVASHFMRERHLEIATTYLRPQSTYWIDHVLTSFYNTWIPLSRFVRASGSMCIIASRRVFNETGGYPEYVVMAEDHDFVYKASQYGKFGVVPLYVSYSMRRFDKEGRWVILYKMALTSIHLVLHGPVEKPLFTYEFGHHAKKEKSNKVA